MLSPWDEGARLDGRTSLLGLQGPRHPLPQSRWGALWFLLPAACCLTRIQPPGCAAKWSICCQGALSHALKHQRLA